MRAVTFTATDLEQIAYERYHYPDPQVQREMEVLWLLHHGETHERVATLAGVSRSSVHRYLTDYLEGGLDLLRRCPHKGSVSLLGGVLRPAPTAYRQGGPAGHRTKDRHPPGTHPGAPLPEASGAETTQGLRHPCA